MTFQHLTAEAEVRALIEWHNQHSDWVVLDFETTSKNPREAKLIDIQMSGREPDEAVLFDARFLPLLLELNTVFVWWNMKYDLTVAALAGCDLRRKEHRDGMLLHHLLDENADHSLDSIVQARYGDKYKEEFWSKYENYLDAPADERLVYGCKDIVYTDRVYREIRTALAADGIPEKLQLQVHGLALSLLGTELQGIQTDLEYTIQMGTALKADIVATEALLRQLAGDHADILELRQWAKEINECYTPKGKKWKTLPKPQFNFSSSGQVAALLYDQIKLPVVISKKTRNRTVDDDALEKLEGQHPIIPELRKLRKYSKMYGSFVEGVLSRVEGSVLYPSFNVNGTVTGRISHSNPNMGQMPSKGEWAKIRGIFIPQAGSKLITCDYGQLEVCVAAHFSQDKNLLRIIYEGASKHDITAEGVGVPRATAKTLNFAMQYQCQWQKVKEIVGCNDAEAKAIWNKYWETYAGERAVIDECNKRVDAGLPIINPFGRHRRFPAHFDENWQRAAAYRQAYSSLIQGTGSDITSTAFYRVAERLKSEGWGRGWFTVHDEILAEVREDKVEAARELIQETMVSVGREISLRVPLTVDCSPGLDRWQKI
jgi:DNA polymerase I-like protein with 3'-5' exonuclease and polymerase domains